MCIISQIKEYLMSIDEYNTPKVVTDKDAIFVLLVRLLLLNPGTFQTHPEMGIGIISRYRYSNPDNLAVLEEECIQQINTYLPELQGASVQLSMTKNKELLIKVTVNDSLYVFETDSVKNTLNLASLINK